MLSRSNAFSDTDLRVFAWAAVSTSLSRQPLDVAKLPSHLRGFLKPSSNYLELDGSKIVEYLVLRKPKWPVTEMKLKTRYERWDVIYPVIAYGEPAMLEQREIYVQIASDRQSMWAQQARLQLSFEDFMALL